MSRNLFFPECSLLALAVSSGFLMPVAAMAQTSPQSGDLVAAQAAESSPSVKEAEAAQGAAIVVTGSRVARSGFEQPTPTVVVGQDFVAKNASSNLADALNLLPQLRPSITPSTNSANVAVAGKNILDLRGLGAQRTLVLVDGQRFVSGIVEGPVDINSIPQALIAGADIVTGGASAAYGSDAVAGVVNIRLLKKFDGVKGVIQGGITDHNDFRNYLASLAWGTSFAGGRGNLILSGEAAQNSGVTSVYNRDWSGAEPGLIANPAYTPTNSEPANLLVRSGAHYSNASYGGLINSGPLKGIQFGPGGVPIPFDYGQLATSTTQQGGDGAYLRHDQVLAVPTRRQVGYGRLSFDASRALQLTADFSYADTRARPVSSTRNDKITIKVDNAFLPTSVRDAMIADGLTSFTMGRFSSDYGSALSLSTTKTWRAALAATGEIGGGWSYDAYYTHGDTESTQAPQGVRINANYAYALDAVINPATGAAVCRDLAARAAGCQPLNLFGSGSPSPDAVSYVATNSWRTARFTQDAGAFTLRGDPLSTWAGPVSVALGGEYRHETTDFTVDILKQQFALATGNGLPWQGEVTVKEVFGEAIVPLVKDAGFAQSIDLDLAGRVTDYNTSGTVETWKVGANWVVNDQIHFRGTISRDIKAPSMADQFEAGLNHLISITDPNLNQTYMIRTLEAGTTSLRPEKATTKTIGVVVENVIHGLRASADYYDIDIKGAISSLDPQSILRRCFEGASAFCSLVTRGSDGTIGQIDLVPLNLQTVTARGLDIEADYSTPVGLGQFTIHANANYVAKLGYSDGQDSVRLDGSVDRPFVVGANGIPHWRGFLSVDYAVGRANLYASARYIGSANINNSFTSKDLNILRVPSVTYVDALISYDVVDNGNKRVKAFLKVGNILDQDPPLTDGLFGTEATIYDLIGRTYTAGVRFDF